MSTEVILLGLRIAVVALLYLLIFQVLATIRRDLKRPSASAAAHGSRPVRLVILEPGHSDLMKGDEIPLEDVSSIGRAQTNSICLNDDFVSAQHAILSLRQKQWWLEDLGSTNGTLVNHRAIGRPVIVTPGDTIEIGRVKLKLEKQD